MNNELHDHDYWLFLGRMMSGKSTLAARMPPDYLVIDLDGRWFEQKNNMLGRCHIIRNNDPLCLVNELMRLRTNLSNGIETIIIDSGTSLLDFETSFERLKNTYSQNQKWMNEAYRHKADIMRTMSGAALRWNANIVWIFHYDDSIVNGQKRIRNTISNLELERLKKSLNAIWDVFIDENGKRGVKLIWCRYNDNVGADKILYDTGMWIGMPERMRSFMRYFTGEEGYNGGVYSLSWLFDFLKGRGRQFASIDEMRDKLGIEKEPLWFDRKAWGEIVQRAG